MQDAAERGVAATGNMRLVGRLNPQDRAKQPSRRYPAPLSVAVVLTKSETRRLEAHWMHCCNRN